MRNRIQLLLAALAVVVALSFSVWSQQQGGTDSAQTQSQASGDHGKMMKNCHQNMQSMVQSNDKLKAKIEDAKRSNDPAKMRAALDDAENSINSMNGQMNSCMGMMNMMENMHGMGMKPDNSSGPPK